MFKGYTASLVGIGDSPIENLSRLFHLYMWLPFTQPDSRDGETDKLLQIQDIKIANVPVRIYKPKHLSNDPDKRLTGVVYLHGGGWTIGSVGKFDILPAFRLAVLRCCYTRQFFLQLVLQFCFAFER